MRADPKQVGSPGAVGQSASETEPRVLVRAPILTFPVPNVLTGSYDGAVRAFVEVDAYEAINLLEALKVAANTGDWHGQLVYKLQELLKVDGLAHRVHGPNIPAPEQIKRIRTLVGP